MYAIVEIQGQQFKVEKGQKLFVHRVAADKNAEFEVEKVLLIDNGGAITVGAPYVSGAKVVLTAGDQVKGEKVLIFHKKRRKGHRKLNGHRQQFTEVTVKDIIA
ncbi:MAG: 50S ribosomal protein L21 [Dysgonomonas sp.]|nr:50S ribosomal protein L21 [Dysgonomonas sp.]